VRSYLNKKREELKREEEGDQVGRAGTIIFASGRPTKAFLRRMRPRILPGMPYVLRRLLRFGETLIQYTRWRVESGEPLYDCSYLHSTAYAKNISLVCCV